MRGINTTLHQIARSFSLQAFRSVIRLLAPLVRNEFNASPIYYDKLVRLLAKHNERRPTGMRFHPKHNSHLSTPF